MRCPECGRRGEVESTSREFQNTRLGELEWYVEYLPCGHTISTRLGIVPGTVNK